MDEDSVSKLKKERAGLSGGAAVEHKLDGIWVLGRGNKEGGSIVLTRLTTCPRTGVGGLAKTSPRLSWNAAVNNFGTRFRMSFSCGDAIGNKVMQSMRINA